MIDRLQNLTGLKKYAALFGFGALMVLGLPPVGFFPVIFASVPALIILTATAPTRFRSFLSGWAFGAGYFIFGLYWVSAALFVDIDQWAWVLPLSLIVGPAVLGIFYGFIPMLVWQWRAKREAYALLFITTWALIEFARGHVLTGFPWNLPGQVWDDVLPVLQTASLVGIYGLSLLTLFWASLPVIYKNRVFAIPAAVSFLVLSVFGVWRLTENPTQQSGAYLIRIAQANLPQNMKWDPDEDWRNLERHIALTKNTEAEKEAERENPPPRFIVWPETASTADLEHFPEIAQIIAAGMPQNSTLVLGNLRVTLDRRQSPVAYHNSVTAMNKKAVVEATYDKHHLVPFGEYIPFRREMSVIQPLALAVSGIGDFTPGSGVKTISLENRPSFSPLICYEVIFPRAVVDTENRPEWLVNVTNDGWYGNSAGPYQHLAISRLRAIEEGLPLVRAANTGISAVVDPVGRIIARQPLLTAGRLDSILPAALSSTPYALYGNMFFYVMAAFFALMGLLHIYKNKKTET
jgi:apolipoprotein N-acyltransferase